MANNIRRAVGGTLNRCHTMSAQPKKMDGEKLFSELEALLGRLGVSVREERLANTAPWLKGGLCKLRGHLYCILDRTSPLEEKNAVLTEALGQIDLEGIYVKPALRQLIRRSVPAKDETAHRGKKGASSPGGKGGSTDRGE